MNVARGEAGAGKPRKTHCKYGHEFTKANTFIGKNGARVCLACRTARNEASYRARRPEGAIANGAKTHCKHGHEFTPENTIVTKTGGRNCRTCQRVSVRDHMRRKRAAANRT